MTRTPTIRPPVMEAGMTSEERTSWDYMNTVLQEFRAGTATARSYLDAWQLWENARLKAGRRPSGVVANPGDPRR